MSAITAFYWKGVGRGACGFSRDMLRFPQNIADYVYRYVDGRLIFSFFIRNLSVLGLRPRC
jgi:hypothetical protein